MNNNPFIRYQNLLKEHIDPRSIPVLYGHWTAPSRYYHNIDHLNDIIAYIQKFSHRVNRDEFEQLILAAFFHDAIYDPMDPKNNEDKSKKFFRDSYIGKNQRFTLVEDLIECTKYRKRPRPFLLQIFWDGDNQGFRKDWMTFLRNEKKIKKEYPKVDENKYREGRIKFLNQNLGLFGARGDTNIRKLIDYLEDK